MPEDYCEAAVLGLGGVGSAAFAELARRGIDVVGIDRWKPPHQLGSSHGQSRIFRIAYFEHPNYVPLAQRSREAWLSMENRVERRVFIPSGGAWIGPNGCRVVRDSQLAADEHGLEYELISGEEANRRWPAFSADSDAVCFYEQDAGIVCPENAIISFLEDGVSNGGTLRCGDQMLELNPSDRDVQIKLSSGVLRAQKVIVTLGAWSSDLLSDVGIALQPQRQVLGWTKPKSRELVREGQLPVWVFSDSDTSIQYGFPICDGMPGPDGAKIARHCQGEPCDPDTVRRTTDAEDEKTLLTDLSDRVPAAAGDLIDTKVCMYTLSKDEHFIVDQHPDYNHVVVGCGFSGHGFKFCPALGEGLADILLEGETALPMDFLSLNRFASPS